MEDRSLELVEHFHCLAGDCPLSCCKGWHIPVDKETLKEYEKLTGVFGRAMRSHIRTKEPAIIRRIFGRCPFHNSERHCQLQKNGQTELMPLVCRVFPRRAIDFGLWHETTMELSCPAAARLLLENPRRLSFVGTKQAIEPLWIMENSDEDFLYYLLAERERLLDYFWTGRTDDSARPRPDGAPPLHVCWQTMYAYIFQVHDWIVRDRLTEAKGVTLTEDKEKQGEFALTKEHGLAFFAIQTLDRMLLEHIDYGLLIVRMPRFYHLIRRYMRYFSKLEIKEADRFFHEKLMEMMEREPAFEKKYRAYFSYNMQQMYLTAYENYFVLRQFLLSVLYTQLLMLFDLVEYLDHGSIPLDRQVQILSWAEHGIRHNPALTHNLFHVIREEFL